MRRIFAASVALFGIATIGAGCTTPSTPPVTGSIENASILLMDGTGHYITERNAENNGEYLRIQNFDPQDDTGKLQEREYILEIRSGGQAPTVEAFTNAFESTESGELGGIVVMYGKDYIESDTDPNQGVGYLKTSGTPVEIIILADTATGIQNGTAIAHQIRFKD